MAEAIITLPDGRKAKLTGPSREAVMEKAQQIMQPGQIIPNGAARPLPAERQQLIPGVPGTTTSTVGGGGGRALEALARSGVESIAGAAAGIPNVLTNVARRVPAQLGFVPPESAPSLADPVIPTPSGQQIIAGAETAVESLPKAIPSSGPGAVQPSREQFNLSEMFGRNLADAEQLAQEHPIADFLGGGAALAVGRAPIAKGAAPGLKALRQAVGEDAKRRLSMIPEEIKDELGDVFTRNVAPFFKDVFRQTKRGGKRAVSTGIEGATLAVLDQGDPETMFWIGAGTQAAGSASLTLATKPVKGLLPFFAAAWLGSEMFKAVAPGDQSFFESKDFAVQKTIAALALGMVSGMAGLGRLRGNSAERFPAMFDAITSVPRGAILSRVQELTNNAKEENDTPLKVMEMITRNPEAFNQNVTNSLKRAMLSEKEGAFTKEVQRLMKESKEFRSVMSGESN